MAKKLGTDWNKALQQVRKFNGGLPAGVRPIEAPFLIESLGWAATRGSVHRVTTERGEISVLLTPDAAKKCVRITVGRGDVDKPRASAPCVPYDEVLRIVHHANLLNADHAEHLREQRSSCERDLMTATEELARCREASERAVAPTAPPRAARRYDFIPLEPRGGPRGHSDDE
jgi:hypothetical protein